MIFRVPVQNPDGTPAMPTKPSRARRMVRDGLAVGKWSDLGVYYIQLLGKPSDRKTQKIVIGVDPGKLYSGVARVYKSYFVFGSSLFAVQVHN
jgi:hypothetical protein